jgi:TPR repeat protein
MKKTGGLFAAFIFVAFCAGGQTASELANERVYQFQQQRIQAMNEEIQQELAVEAADAARREAIRRRAEAIEATLQNYPWRVVDGITQHVAVTWCVFNGRVLQTSPDGVRVDGAYASIYPDGAVSCGGEFFVKHFPYSLADGDSLPAYVAGLPEGVYTYTTVMNAERSIHCLDFGVPCNEPQWAIDAETNKPLVTPDQVAARRALAESNVVHYLECQASNGDVDCECELGEKFMTGDGAILFQDKGAGQIWLRRAEYGGSIEASNYLQNFALTNGIASETSPAKKQPASH